MCPVCKEPFPKSDMESHMATEHCQVNCQLTHTLINVLFLAVVHKCVILATVQ
jgi:hypothetical protein